MSIAVLRTFISKRKEEHEALLSKRMQKASKVSENHAANGSSNGECEPSEVIPEGEPCSNGDEPEKAVEGRAPRELKPTRVLEVPNFPSV